MISVQRCFLIVISAGLLMIGMGQVAPDLSSLGGGADTNPSATKGQSDASGAERKPLNPVSIEGYWSGPIDGDAELSAVALLVEVEPPYHINPDKPQITPGFEFLIPTKVEAGELPAGVTLGAVQYPGTHQMDVNFTGKTQQVAVFEKRVVIYVPMRGVESGDQLSLKVTYQACDPRSCLMPKTVNVDVVAELADGQVSRELFANFDASDTGSFSSDENEADGDEAEASVGDVAFDVFGLTFSLNPAGFGGLVALMLVAAIGGMLLNFTPCVLPVIPLKIMSLSNAAGSRGRCLLLGATMAAGVMLFWLALGAAVSLISGFAAANQLFQYPAFTLTVGIIIAVLAVGMCGLFSIQLPAQIYSFTPKQDTVLGSIGFGVMTAVLSTPCTAPLMGGAAAWAATQHPSVTMLVFCAIGVGMALPYLVLSAFPRLVERVPRAGEASVLVKQVMGLLMLAVAAFFIGIGISGWLTNAGEPPNTFYWWVVVGLVSAAGLWLAWRVFRISNSVPKRTLATIAAVVTLAASVYVGLAMTEKGLWGYYTPERLAAAIERGDVVVLDFTAEWCLNCKVLEKTVLADERVEEMLRREGVTAMKVDLTPADNHDAAAMLARVNRVTIPLLVVLNANGEEVFKSDAYTPQQVIDAVTAAGG